MLSFLYYTELKDRIKDIISQQEILDQLKNCNNVDAKTKI